MSKEKTLGLSNTEDVMWYSLSPSDETLRLLDEIFDIYDNLYEEDAKKIHSYAFHTEFGEMHFHKETESFIAYFIFTKTSAHVILRKILKWKKFSDLINKKFEFVKWRDSNH